MAPRTLLLVGPGKAGTALAALATAAGVRVVAIAGSAAHPARARETADALGLGADVWTGALDALPSAVIESAELVVLATPDDRIADAAATLARVSTSTPTTPAPPRTPRPIAWHCSGSQPSTVLDPLRAAGFALGSLHPLKAMPEWRAARESFPGTPCCVEGDADAAPVLTEFARAIDGEPFTIPTAAKAHYHAGAVMASNQFVALMAAAVHLYTKQLGVTPQRALDLLLRLSRGTLDNLASTGLPAALTGPIERGDVATVRAHLDALDRDAPDIAAAYRALSSLTLDVARAKAATGAAPLTAEAAAQLAALFESPPAAAPAPPRKGVD